MFNVLISHSFFCQINVMQKELIELQPQLIQTSKETEELIEIIEKESVEVQEVKDVVEIDEAAAAKAAAEAKAIKVNNDYMRLCENDRADVVTNSVDPDLDLHCLRDQSSIHH